MLILHFLYNTYLYWLLTYYIDVSKPKKKFYWGHQLLVGNFNIFKQRLPYELYIFNTYYTKIPTYQRGS